MITTKYIKTMAQYNLWQNNSLYQAADTLSANERLKDRGAFFGSIHGTLSHLLWGDQIWLSRFAGTPKPAVASIPESNSMVADWDELSAQRKTMDQRILDWANGLADADVTGDLTWFSGAVGREVSKPKGMLITHMFNHQTHHRGQVHAMLTQAGARPDDTDLFILETE